MAKPRRLDSTATASSEGQDFQAEVPAWQLFFTADDPKAQIDCLAWLRAIDIQLEFLSRAAKSATVELLSRQGDGASPRTVRDHASAVISQLEHLANKCDCLVPHYRTPLESAAASSMEVLEGLSNEKFEILFQSDVVPDSGLLWTLLGTGSSIPTKTVRKMEAVERLQTAVGNVLAEVKKYGFDPAPPQTSGSVRTNFVAGRGQGNGPKPTVNERMKETIDRIPESKSWSKSQWATHLTCGETTVSDTDTWATLADLRAQANAERRIAKATRKPTTRPP